MFRIGQKVVCIADEDFQGRPFLLEKDHIYTVARVFDWFGVQGVVVAEVDPPAPVPGWHHICFRPVVERKTNIDIFTAMLTDERLPDLVTLQRAMERT